MTRSLEMHSAQAKLVAQFFIDRERGLLVRSALALGCGRERIAAIIDGAKKSLWLQNERYQDTVIVERLVRAVNRGVRVKIMARAPHKLSGKKLAEGIGALRIMHDVGAKVHLLK